MPILESPIQIIRQISGFDIQSTTDSPDDKRVQASVRINYSDGNSRVKDFPLWEGDAYDAIGDWTQAQAEARVLELISA